MTIKVGIVGYGTIGRRVADGVKASSGMEIIGVTARSYARKLDAAKDREGRTWMCQRTRSFHFSRKNCLQRRLVGMAAERFRFRSKIKPASRQQSLFFRFTRISSRHRKWFCFMGDPESFDLP